MYTSQFASCTIAPSIMENQVHRSSKIAAPDVRHSTKALSQLLFCEQGQKCQIWCSAWPKLSKLSVALHAGYGLQSAGSRAGALDEGSALAASRPRQHLVSYSGPLCGRYVTLCMLLVSHS